MTKRDNSLPEKTVQKDVTSGWGILESSLSLMPSSLADRITTTGLPIVVEDQKVDYLLTWDEDTLQLTTPDGGRLRAQWKRPHAVNSRQPFTRALAPARHGTVIDATAGLGGDSLQLALLADQVICIERHPVVYAMLLASIYKARSESWPVADRIEAHHGDAAKLLFDFPPADVVFLDPMFPFKRKRSALPPNTVRIIRQLVGDDTDGDNRLFTAALRQATCRVVVKRPLHAPPMAPDPQALHEGKVVRYEVYKPLRDDR